MLQIGTIDLAAAQAVLARRLPKGSLPGLVGAGALMALRGAVLPAAHWFDTGRPLGELAARARR